MPPLYRRVDTAERGRHLGAAEDIERGRLLWAERPLLALQSLDNLAGAWLCHECFCFVGGPNGAMQRRFRGLDTAIDHSDVFPCRHACGQVYCSTACEQTAWATQHDILCTGECEADHPLVEFKKFAVSSNEILLLVAQWWVVQHRANDSAAYTDFCMEPWWDVETLDLVQQPGGFVEAAGLQASLKDLCSTAAEQLNAALQGSGLPFITAEDIGRRVGACAQNAIGIRQRHPLCREIFDRDFREQWHAEIVQALAQAGFIGSDDDEEGNGEGETASKQEAEEDQDWDYSVEEIAAYLSSLFIDEEGSVRDENKVTQERDTVGDDLDYVFSPVDGTAMYSLTCKMNHACDPNVIVLYKSMGWGSRCPLTAFCIAMKNIRMGDELTISYVDKDQMLEDRQRALVNYGFVCNCLRCQHESSGVVDSGSEPAVGVTVEDDPFGEASDENDTEDPAGEEADDEDPEASLERVRERLETAINHSQFGVIPRPVAGPVFAAIIQRSVTLCKEIDDPSIVRLLQHCVNGSIAKDYCMCKIAGEDLERTLYEVLKAASSWPSTAYREAYWCGVLAAAIGLAHDCSFVEALYLLDKGMVLGLVRTEPSVAAFLDYVEQHANAMARAPRGTINGIVVGDYREPRLVQMVERDGLVRPIECPIIERPSSLPSDEFQRDFSSRSRAVVLRAFASKWPATDKWRHLRTFTEEHGHRIVPIELGSMLAGALTEALLSIKDFVSTYLAPNAKKSCWSFKDAVDSSNQVAYLAQHPLLSQIPDLHKDLPMKPDLLGPEGPSNVYVWFGTGGTRTPLHFDSYDNLFVQVVGAKYIRLYHRDETPKLYVSRKSAFGLQGNMSEVNCEAEDMQQHPLVQSAHYEEVLLLPGDCLYIPAGMWHYVRALSTSISVNYWF